MAVAGIIQARMTSTRLPGKVLLRAAGREMLAHQVDRVRRARRLTAVCIATTTNATDDPVAELAAREGVFVTRGSETDVLGRVFAAAEQLGADTVVRLTGDCPLSDPELIDAVVDRFLTADPPVAYASNSIPRTWPIGLDVEVASMAALTIAHREATDPYDREHVTPFLYRNPDRFRMIGLPAPRNLGAERWTLDEPADFEFLTKVLEALLPENPNFGWQDVMAVLAKHPEWRTINASVGQKLRRYEGAVEGNGDD